MLMSRGQKREIYWWFTQDARGLQLIFSKTLTRNQPYPKMGSHPLFIGRKRNPQNNSRSGPETVLTRLSIDCSVDHSMPSIIIGLTENVGRSTPLDSPSSCNIGRPPGRPIQTFCMSVGRSIDRSPIIELKTLSHIFALPLCILHLSEDFSNLSQILMNIWRNRHMILAWALRTKSTHNLDLAERLTS